MELHTLLSGFCGIKTHLTLVLILYKLNDTFGQ